MRVSGLVKACAWIGVGVPIGYLLAPRATPRPTAVDVGVTLPRAREAHDASAPAADPVAYVTGAGAARGGGGAGGRGDEADVHEAPDVVTLATHDASELVAAVGRGPGDATVAWWGGSPPLCPTYDPSIVASAIPVGVPGSVQRDRRGGLRPVVVPAAADVPQDEELEAPSCDHTDAEAPLGPFEACLSARLGTPVWTGFLDAKNEVPLRVAAPDACEYLLVVEGVFKFSYDGYQDALRRWHTPIKYDFEPFCTACGADELEILAALAIDGVARRPLAECPLAHSYLYRVTPQAGAFDIVVNDYGLQDPTKSNHADNEGGLRLTLYTVASDHELLARYVDTDHVLGIPVGLSLGAQRLGFEPGGTPTALLLLFPDLATFRTEASWLVDPARRYVLALRGFATVAPGIEADPVHRWPPMGINLTSPFVLEGCSRHDLAGADQFAHTAAFELSGCSAVTVRTTIERPAGVIEAELFER